MFMMRRYVFCIIFIHCSLISFSQLTQSKADALLTQLNEFTIDNYVEVREQCNELISFYTKTGSVPEGRIINQRSSSKKYLNPSKV